MMLRLVVVMCFLPLGAGFAAALDPISSAELCGGCHRAIHEAWKSSAHATAMESRLFQDAVELAVKDFGSGAKKTCLGCHSPIGVHLGDLSLQRKVSWEGVTCDYCHSVRSVDLDSGNPKAKVEYSLVKTGPIKEASAIGHETAYSEVHTSSQICAPCHEYQNSHGYAVLATYSEWKASRYATEKIGCQSCHMGVVEGDVVRPDAGAASGHVNLHEMPGGHSLTQLNKAVQMRMRSLRTDDMLNVTITITNGGAGHYVPTGSAMRKMVLQVEADAHNKGADFQEERVYQRVVAGVDGAPLSREHFVFFNGAKVLSDTRLAPDEKRTESFSFAIPKANPVQLRATLSYHYSPLAQTEAQEQLVFRSIKRFIR